MVLKAKYGVGLRVLVKNIGCCGVSVEPLVFIVIGRSCSEGCGFDSHCRPGSFLRFNSRPIMYGAVGSMIYIELVLDTTTWVHFLLMPLDSIV